MIGYVLVSVLVLVLICVFLYSPIETFEVNSQMIPPMVEARLSDVIYSGDLIEIRMGDDDVLQRMVNNSQLLLNRNPTNLSKLRIENLDDQGPLRYGQTVYIKHNTLIDNMNQTRFIKYGIRLNSHQEGPIYNMFKLVKKDRIESQDYIKYGDQFFIANGDSSSGDKVYLRLEDDRSISCEATIEHAIVFNAVLIRNKDELSLCICLGETIYA